MPLSASPMTNGTVTNTSLDALVLSRLLPVEGLTMTKYRSSPNLDGSWNENLLPAPSGRRNQFPMDFAIINFPAQ